MWLLIPLTAYDIHLKQTNNQVYFILEHHVKYNKVFIAKHESLTYCPHILNYKVHEYCLAHILETKPQQYYMTYDFKTMKKIIN